MRSGAGRPRGGEGGVDHHAFLDACGRPMWYVQLGPTGIAEATGICAKLDRGDAAAAAACGDATMRGAGAVVGASAGPALGARGAGAVVSTSVRPAPVALSPTRRSGPSGTTSPTSPTSHGGRRAPPFARRGRRRSRRAPSLRVSCAGTSASMLHFFAVQVGEAK